MNSKFRHLILIFVASLLATPLSAATLNLKDADIRVLIDTVSEATGKNFIIDPRVKAKVNVISSKEMKRDEVYEVFLSILQVHGFSAVPSGEVIKIVPDVAAKAGSVPTYIAKGKEDSDQLITQVVALENISATQLVPILRPLVPQQGHLAAHPSNNVLVITDRASNIQRLLSIIRRIDRPDNDEIEIIKLEYASATEVVRIITQLSQKGPSTAGADKTSITADERTNSILITGERAKRARLVAIIKELDTPLESTGNTKVIFLKYANAKDMVSILQGVSTKATEQQGKGQSTGNNKREGVDIQADEANNALIITAQPSMIQELIAIIRQLDIPRAQVMIEAIIAEVSTDNLAELGSQFLIGATDETGEADVPLGGALFPDIAGALPTGENKAADVAAVVGKGFGVAVGSGGDDGETSFAVLLKAIRSDTANNILSTPSIVTLDNVEAEIVVGENVPFITGSFSNTGGSGNVTNPFQTIQREDVGLTLKIKPQINEGDAIKLEIEQETSSVKDNTSASGPTTTKRSIKTQILVRDGQMIVLGGLTRDEFRDKRAKVPLLGSIPVLGRLFSYTATTKVKSNLMVFIRPVILHDSKADYFTAQKYSVIRESQVEAKIGKRGLLDDKLLPDIEVIFAPIPDLGESTSPAP